jgi:hypothetical protein
VRNLFRLLLVLWAGSLWAVGLWVAPTLFFAQPDRHLAGLLAGRIFTVEAYLGAAVGLLALLLPGRGKFLWGYAAAALLAVNEWALRPVMAEARSRGAYAGLTFGGWHGVSTVLYALSCIALVSVIWNQDRR